MKPLFKSTKVVYNASRELYEVYFREWFRWHLDSVYKYDKPGTTYFVHYRDQAKAEAAAIARAKAMLNTVEVWRGNMIAGALIHSDKEYQVGELSMAEEFARRREK